MRRLCLMLAVFSVLAGVAPLARALEPFASVGGTFVGIKDRRAVTINVSVMRGGNVVQTTTGVLDEQLKFSAVLFNIQGFTLNSDKVRIEVRHVENVSLPIGLDDPVGVAYNNFYEPTLTDITLNVGIIRVKWLVRVRVTAAQGLNFLSFYGDPSASVGALLVNVFNPWPTFVLANDDANQGQLNTFLEAAPPLTEPLQPWQGFIASFAEARTIEFWGAEWTPEQMLLPLIRDVLNIRGIPFVGANITPDTLWTKLVEIQAQPRVLALYDSGLAMWYVRTADFTTPLTSSQRRAFNLMSGDAWIVIPGAEKTLDMRTMALAAPGRNLRESGLTDELRIEDVLARAPITEEQRSQLSRIVGITPSRRVSAEGKLPTLWSGLKRR